MSLPTPVPGLQPGQGALIDRFGRPHTYLRISVTDRCNYRCTYCMPAEGLEWLPRSQVLTYEEIGRLAAVFGRLGIERVRLTGGEPTVRRDIEQLVAAIAAVPSIRDIAMTTNGHTFAAKAEALARAGLRRVNISIDSLDPSQFREMTRGGDLRKVLESIDAARALGIVPVKLNCVVVNGVNDDQIEAMVERFADHAADTVIRFIEFMPFGGNGERRLHLPASTIRERLARRWTLERLSERIDGHPPGAAIPSGGGPSRDWRIAETGQIVGFISPITEHFCDSCNRLRLQADGHLRTCLSRDGTPSLRDLLRKGATDEALAAAIRGMVWQKVAGHEAHLDEGFHAFEGVMTRIGG